jgi:hypothetical protein
LKPALVADAIRAWHARIVERQDGRVAAAVPELVELAADAEAGRGGRHDDERHAAGATLTTGPGQQSQEIGLGAVGDPHLGPVDDEVFAVDLGPGPDGGHIRAGVGLADRDGRDHLAPNRRDEEALFERLGAVPSEGRGGHVGMHAQAQAHPHRLGPAQFLEQHSVEPVVGPAPAISLGIGQSQQAERAHLLEQRMGGENAGTFPGLGVRIDLSLDEVAGHLAQHGVFGRKWRWHDHLPTTIILNQYALASPGHIDSEKH